MLRPADCVANRGGPLRARCSSETMRDFVKKVGRDTADFLDHLRRVAGEMTFQFLKNTLRILQRKIAQWSTQVAAFVNPTVAFIGALFFVPTGEIAVAVVFRIAVFVRQNA